jgi:hypothetical protein
MVVVYSSGFLARLALSSHPDTPRAANAPEIAPVRMPEPPPAVVVQPTPEPTPVMLGLKEYPKYVVLTPEVRRAELATSEAIMPDGSIVSARILGSVNTQEQLPLYGNHFGDAYRVNGIPFVWTRLHNGQGVGSTRRLSRNEKVNEVFHAYTKRRAIFLFSYELSQCQSFQCETSTGLRGRRYADRSFIPQDILRRMRGSGGIGYLPCHR